MTFSCHDYGNPTLDKCRFCNDRAACEEEFQTRFTKEEAPLVDYNAILHDERFEKLVLLGSGALIGGSLVVIIQSSFGIPMAVFVMAAVFGAGYMVGGDSKKKKVATPKAPPRRRYSR